MRKTIREQFDASPEWKPYLRYSPVPIKLIDGSKVVAVCLMKRRGPDGTMQYRLMTEKEKGLYASFPG